MCQPNIRISHKPSIRLNVTNGYIPSAMELMEPQLKWVWKNKHSIFELYTEEAVALFTFRSMSACVSAAEYTPHEHMLGNRCT